MKMSETLHLKVYRISLVMKQSFFLSFQNNSKNLDLSYKMDLDLWDCLGRVKIVIAKFHRAGLIICSHSR